MININAIYCTDNLVGMKKIFDNFVDLTVTSPPYDGLRKYNGYSFDFENVAKELFRITKLGGVVVWVVNDQTKNGTESGTSFRQALFFKEIGFNLHDTMIWRKTTMPLSHNRYEQAFEYMFVFSKGKPNTFNGIRVSYSNKTLERINAGDAFSYKHRNGQENEKIVISNKRKINSDGLILDKNVWDILPDISLKKEQKYLLDHPARFPYELAKKHILSWSNEGDLVFDPFVGSGTTAKAANDLNRNYLGFDISQKYIDIANRRINE